MSKARLDIETEGFVARLVFTTSNGERYVLPTPRFTVDSACDDITEVVACLRVGCEVEALGSNH